MADDIEKQQFPANSHRMRLNPGQAQEPVSRKIEKVVTGQIVRKKKSFADNFAELFFGDDAKSVGNYILFDVLIPAAKNTISEMVSSGIEMLLFGEAKGKGLLRDRNKSYVSYSSFYNRGDRDRGRERQDYSRVRATHRFDDIIIPSRGEAEEVLSNLVDLIDEYNAATVADFYALVGISSDYADVNYGWTNLSRAYVERVRQGYVISLPKPVVLE